MPWFLGPALAGVAPAGGARRRAGGTRPRARGGCSSLTSVRTWALISAPRSRGLLLAAEEGHRRADLGPALAGVAPSARSPAVRRPPRPRARGGCSYQLQDGIRPADSAPRSRGLLPLLRVGGDGGVLGPALAGVAPLLGPVRTARHARPRARGGCSGSPRCCPPVRPSAPRSRGLLPVVRSGTAAHRLGPALAGVAPPPRASPPSPPARPRARGGCSVWAAEVPEFLISAPRSRGLLHMTFVGPTGSGLGPALAGVALPVNGHVVRPAGGQGSAPLAASWMSPTAAR